MANVMSMKNVKNKVHRSGFDLSRRNCYSCKVGEIMSVGIIETLPGDNIKVKISNFLRTRPLASSTFGRMRHYIDAYFVPNDLLWDKFSAWVVQTQQPFHAKSVISSVDKFSSQPYVLPSDIVTYLRTLFDTKDLAGNHLKDDGGLDRLVTTGRLLEALGYGRFVIVTSQNTVSVVNPHKENQPLNIFPLLAYQKVYQDYFRFSQWEDSAPWTFNLDYVQTEKDLHIDIASLSSALVDVSNLFDMRYCNYDKDLFFGLLPRAQFGDETIAGPISGQLGGSFRQVATGADGHTQGNIVADLDNGYNLAMNATLDHTIKSTASLSLNSDHPNFENTAGLSILLLREAQAYQKWKEITLSGDLDFADQMYKHWNVKVSDEASFKCKYLGGVSSTVEISEVTNTNLTEENSQASLFGQGSLRSSGQFDFSTNKYGFIILVSHIKPVIEWNSYQVIDPVMYRHEVTDYAVSEFDNLGMQPLYTNVFSSLVDSGSAASDAPSAKSVPDGVVPLGFGPRYMDYKTSYDRASGLFTTPSFRSWTITHSPGRANGLLTPSFFRVTPEIVNPLFFAQVSGDFAGSSMETDAFLNSLYLDIKNVRNLSYDGMPY